MKDNQVNLELHRAYIASTHIRDLQQASARLYTLEEYIRYWSEFNQRHENVLHTLIQAAQDLFPDKKWETVTVWNMIELISFTKQDDLFKTSERLHVGTDMRHIIKHIQDTFFCSGFIY